MVRDAHLAQDVTQSVFVALARNARQLTDRPVLSGWLHRTAQNLAANAIRSDVRRRAREQKAATMNELLATQSDATWEQVAPHLDTALGELSESDRDAVLLRYFEGKSAREIAQTLGVSDEAAQKRVNRAVERLREFFAKRGITVGAGGLAVVLSANAVQAAPVGLAVTISTAAALTGTTFAVPATGTATKTIAMTTLQKTLIATTLAASVGTGIFEAHRASTLRTQAQTFQQRQAPLTDQIKQLQQERDDATARQAALEQEREQLQQTVADVPRLRGEVARLRAEANQTQQLRQEIDRLRSAQRASTPDVAASSTALLAYLGEAVAPPATIEPAYTKEGLRNALEQAAQLAGVPLKKLEIETSEFPFLAGVVCETQADFEKLKSQLKGMPNYEYAGGTGSEGSCAFNMTPHRSFPSDAGQRIARRTILRTQMFFDQLAAR